MSEPKGPPALDDAGAARRASSKKASSKRPAGDALNGAAPPAYATATAAGPTMATSQLSTAPAAASPVPKLHDVPRIPIAEPKPALDAVAKGDGSEKPRASKKRTSTPPSGPVGTPPNPAGSTAGATSAGAPTVDATAAAKQETADTEREKKAVAVRREAKRQRAKEAEDAKRREELAKQAMEETKRQEEARLREERRKQELAALNANAEECQEEEDDAGGYDDDGFENYDDDFEDDDKPPEKNPGAKPQTKAKAKGGNNNNDALMPAEVKKIQQAMQAESKELSTSRPSSSSSKATSDSSHHNNNNNQDGAERKKSATTSIASSIAGLKQSLDPRAKRAKEILDARKFEVEKFNLFHQAPLSEQETYLSNLRRGQVRQVAIYTNDGAKSSATQTKYPAGVDQGMYFPDDIGLDSASSSASAAKRGDVGGNAYEDEANVTSTVRFFKFLENAAYVCELLAEGNAMAAEQELEENNKNNKKRFSVTRNTSLAQRQLFPNKQFDDPALESLLQGRELVAMRFSPCMSNIFITCYGVQELKSGEQQKAPLWSDKGISCVWDVNQPHQVLYVLKNEGSISTVCLSPNREVIALAGTEDGSIHVWDLRRQEPYRRPSSGNQMESIEVCSPTYSTCGVDYRTTSQHTSTIVAIEVIDRRHGNNNNANHNATAGGNFQFGSMDDRGIVIIWSLIEFEAGEDALITDKCVEIGGRVKMMVNTMIDTQQLYMVPKQPKVLQRTASSSSSGKTSNTATLPTAAVSKIGPIATVFKFLSHDPNQFVVGTRTGFVFRGHRFEKANASLRPQYRRDKGALASAGGVVCIDFHPFILEYFLVGYEDGCIWCVTGYEFLDTLEICQTTGICLSAWEEVPFGVSVSSLQWSTSRPGVFYASFSNAQVLVWDLTEQTT
uniref:Uncharacterized protein n=1 Tax=Globisporangium ultimum (strain ATCC 200006 / CBS 805.95 / DAOM BR144) TaxID=431595 RepID=K3WT81_GLOUD